MLIGCASLVICFSQIASANEASFFFFYQPHLDAVLLSILESFIINKAWQLHQILQRHQILEVACNE
jgi:cyclic lactone autoinducer peptide